MVIIKAADSKDKAVTDWGLEHHHLIIQSYCLSRRPVNTHTINYGAAEYYARKVGLGGTGGTAPMGRVVPQGGDNILLGGVPINTAV